MKSNALMICLCIFFYAQVCAQNIENFSLAPLTSSYADSFYTGNYDIIWQYSKAKGGQKTSLNSQSAICLNKAASAYLQSDSISGGISFLEIEYEQEYSSNIHASVFINNSKVGILQSDNEADITKIFSLDSLKIEGKFILKILQNSSSAGQISISKIEWKTYTSENTPAELEEIIPKPEVIIPKDITFGDIIISELMVDPTPTLGLQDYEYIELYNTTNDSLNLDSLELIVGTKHKLLPECKLAPKSFVILCSSTAQKSAYAENSIAISSFPSLANTGTTIALVNKNSIISSITYSSKWYKNEFKDAGGWSLEKMDLHNMSETSKNWTASTSYSGGTPAYINSVNSNVGNNTPIIIEELFLQNDTCLQIHFSQNIHIDSISFLDINYEAISAVNYNMRDYIITLSKECKNGKTYSLQFKNSEYTFGLKDSLLLPQSIIVSELLSNPSIGQSDYIVLQNNSLQTFDISAMYLAKSNEGAFESITQIQPTKQLFTPGQKLVLSADVEYWKTQSSCSENALFIACNIPSLADESGHILICNKWGEIIDSAYYSEDMHNPLLETAEGVAFTRVGTHNLFVSNSKPSPACEKVLEKSCIITTENQKVKKGSNQAFSAKIKSTELIKEVSVQVFSQQGALQYSETFACNDYSKKINWNAFSNAGNILPASVYFMVIQAIGETSIIDSKEFTIIVTD